MYEPVYRLKDVTQIINYPQYISAVKLTPFLIMTSQVCFGPQRMICRINREVSAKVVQQYVGANFIILKKNWWLFGEADVGLLHIVTCSHKDRC